MFGWKKKDREDLRRLLAEARERASESTDTPYDQAWQETITKELGGRPRAAETQDDAEIEVHLGDGWKPLSLAGSSAWGLPSNLAEYARGHAEGHVAPINTTGAAGLETGSLDYWQFLANQNRRSAEFHRARVDAYRHGYFVAVAERCEAAAMERLEPVDGRNPDAENREDLPVEKDVEAVTFKAEKGRLAGVTATFTGGTNEQRWNAGEALGRYSDGHHFVSEEVAGALAPLFGQEGGYNLPIGDLFADTVQRLAEMAEIELDEVKAFIVGGTLEERAEMAEQLEYLRSNGPALARLRVEHETNLESLEALRSSNAALERRLEHARLQKDTYLGRIAVYKVQVEELQAAVAAAKPAEDSGLLRLPDDRETLVAAEHVAALEAKVAQLEEKNHRQARIIAGDYAPADVVVSKIPTVHPTTKIVERKLAEAQADLRDLRAREHALRIQVSTAELAQRKAERQRTKVAAKAYKRGYARGERRGKAEGARAARAQMSVGTPTWVVPEMSVTQRADVEEYLDRVRQDQLISAVSAFWGDRAPLTLTYMPVETGSGVKMRGVPQGMAIMDETHTWAGRIPRDTDDDEQKPETD